MLCCGINLTASIPGRAANRSADYNDLVIQRTKLKFGQHIYFLLPTCNNNIYNIITLSVAIANVDIVMGHWSSVGGNIDIVLLLLLLILCY